mmetsp:Transcript_37421/g.101345  ORF Transcript_37421/g.101345 Transcript_37421/m.101345 type:complete len:446 (+) Transcript_37421:783-2120(+)
MARSSRRHTGASRLSTWPDLNGPRPLARAEPVSQRSAPLPPPPSPPSPPLPPPPPALREACHINKSLYTLGKVIRGMLAAQGRSGKRGGVSFRDSNMTKLLIGSLGGSGKTVMLGCVSPAASQTSESIRTMQFAMQVKGIRNRPVINLDPREKLIKELKDEIHRLRDENARLRSNMLAAPTSVPQGLGSTTLPSHAAPAKKLLAATTQPAPSSDATQFSWSETTPALPSLGKPVLQSTGKGPGTKSLNSASSVYGRGKASAGTQPRGGKRRPRPDQRAPSSLPPALPVEPNQTGGGGGIHASPHTYAEVRETTYAKNAEDQVMALLMQLGTGPSSPSSLQMGNSGIGRGGGDGSVGPGQVDALLATIGLGSNDGPELGAPPLATAPVPAVQSSKSRGVDERGLPLMRAAQPRSKRKGKVPLYGQGRGYQDLMQRHQHRNSGSFLF